MVPARPRIQNLSVVDGFPNDTSINTYHLAIANPMLRWNYADGVDNFERRKNDVTLR